MGKSASSEQLHCSKCHQLVRNPHLSSTNSMREIPKYSQLQSISPKAAENDNMILSKFVCRETDEMEHALHRV